MIKASVLSQALLRIGCFLFSIYTPWIYAD